MPSLRRMISTSGQTLVEVTFATAVVSLVLVALLSSVIQSLRNARQSLEQTKSTQYAQEVLEWLRGTRDREGWGVFYGNLVAVGTDLTYCLPAVASDSADLVLLDLGACAEDEVIPDTIYTRQLRLEILSTSQIKATSQVSRPGRAGTITTTIESLLGDWE